MLKGGFEKGKVTESIIISKASRVLSQAFCWVPKDCLSFQFSHI